MSESKNLPARTKYRNVCVCLVLISSLFPYQVPSVKPRTSSYVEPILQQSTSPPSDLSFDSQCYSLNLLSLAPSQAHL